MKKLFLLLLALGMAAPAGAQIVSASARVNYLYDLISTSYIYCKYTGLSGDPFGSPMPGPGLIKTSGSSTTVTELTTGDNPFAQVAAGDILFISVGGAISTRLVATRVSAAEITVDSSITLTGNSWSWMKRSCGTTISDGWVDAGGFYNVTFTRTITTINATSIQTQAECRLNDNPTVATIIVTDSSTTTGNWGYTLTSGAWDACRLGVKVTTDTGVQSLTSALSVSRLNGAVAPSYSKTYFWRKALTESSATSVVQIGVPQTAGVNFADATIHWVVYASDGTNTQTLKGADYLTAVNAAGTETCTRGAIGTAINAVSSGTLTCTPTCVTGLTDAVQFALNCASNLTQTSLDAFLQVDVIQSNTVVGQ